MQQLKKIILLIFVLIIKHNCLLAQTYPIHLTTIITPPFSGYLSDYAGIGNQNFKLIVLFNDFTKPSYNIKLKFKLTGQNINLQSKNYYYEGPFTLIPGVPLEISGSDIAGLLNSNNIDFTGLSKQQYETSKVLPEGLYTLCFTAYDFNNPTPIQVSNESCFSAWMMLNDPPYLNIPFCGNVQAVTTPQNIIFQWTSLNLISPNSINNTAYEFSLYEIRPKGADPFNIIQTLQPIYQTTTNVTTLNYGLTDPVLNVGMDYVWRVKAIDLSGRDLFKNQGYSQHCTFTYGSMTQFIDSTAIAINLHGTSLNYRMAKCFWDTLSVYKNYTLHYRKQNGTNWFTNSNVTSGYSLLQNLEPSTTYQAYLKGNLLDNSEGPISNTVTIITPAKTEYACGQSPGMQPTQIKPLLQGGVGQIWEVGQFDVVVTSLNNPVSPIGQYSGYGKIAVPFLGNANFNVKFNNIIVNEEFQVIAGRIDVVTEGMNTWMHNIDIHNAEENATYVNGTITNFTINGGQYCYTVQATNTQVCDTLPTHQNVFVVRDDNGNQYTMELKPPPPKLTGPTSYLNYSADNLDASDSMMVNFNASTLQNFGFDKKEYAAFIKNYEVIKLRNNKNYFVSNKSVGENQTDEVLAQVQILNFSASQLSFKTQSGTVLTSIDQGNLTYKITGIPAAANCVYAWYNNKKIGKLNVSSLKTIAKKVVIVPVNGSASPPGGGLEGALNDIFKQANVTWTVSTAPNFTFNLGADGLEAADATLMNKYSSEMRALRNSYKDFDSLYDKNACYLFVIPNFSSQNINGYMVRNRAVGFIKSGITNKEIAHELAHGAFGLEHSFPKIAKGTSTNLMDYSNGSSLVLEQWNDIQNPNSSFSWLDNEEDGSYLGPNNTSAGVFYWINNLKIAYKNNTSVTIPKNTTLIGRAAACYLGGVQYDSICVYVQDYSYDMTAVVRNSAYIGTAQKQTLFGTVTYSCIGIDNGKIIIEVPTGRLNNMLYYIKNTQTFKNLILFVNGYRPTVNGDGDQLETLVEYANSTNQIEFGDSRNYWKGIDAQFMTHIGTRTAVYADGHHSVGTSNHQSVANYLGGNVLSKQAKIGCLKFGDGPLCHTYGYLHTTPNTSGFLARQTNGEQAANDLISRISGGSIVFNKLTDTLDIVAHSMGYAYAVGMIKKLDLYGIKFGRFYILAPENACSGGVDWSNFKEIWQYGTNEDIVEPYLQDGVAPQCLVKDLDHLTNSTKGGRVYIPYDYWPKGYLESHTVKNYDWIFKKLTPQDDGYVKSR